MFRCYSYTIIRKCINLCLPKLQLLKRSIKIHRCVVNTVVVWLLILGAYWCMSFSVWQWTVLGNALLVVPQHTGLARCNYLPVRVLFSCATIYIYRRTLLSADSLSGPQKIGKIKEINVS